MFKRTLNYYLLRVLTIPFSYLSYKTLHFIGRLIGILAFYTMRDFRKRALSNLALATDLNLSKKELIDIAKKSFENLAINVLEYAKLGKDPNLEKLIQCENPQTANELFNQKKGIIFFCGHQSNWEVLFLDGNSRMKGIAIGRPIKNEKLYQWIVKIREKMGGKIIAPRNAVKEGLRNLRRGIFMGIVGDQGMPDSNYSFPFFGRRAWTSTAPALLSYKTNSPIIVATTRREDGGYKIHYSDPIWPDQNAPVESEITRLMNSSLLLLQESIRQSPGEWLWQHNRWKQQTPKMLYKEFRQDCICIILPEDNFSEIAQHLPTLKKIYHRDFIILFIPEKYKNEELIEADERLYYKEIKETLIKDYRFKLIFNFTDYNKIHSHFEKLSTFETLSIKHLKYLASFHLPKEELSDLSKVLKAALCRPGAII